MCDRGSVENEVEERERRRAKPLVPHESAGRYSKTIVCQIREIAESRSVTIERSRYSRAEAAEHEGTYVLRRHRHDDRHGGGHVGRLGCATDLPRLKWGNLDLQVYLFMML